jgi:hypothetical protein
MAIDDEAQGTREYLYCRCATCGVKIHILSRKCWKCGGRYGIDEKTLQYRHDGVYSSNDPRDEMCSRRLNDPDLCFMCETALKGKSCPAVSCFGTGRGKCGDCERYSPVRFSCCQKLISEDPPPYLNAKAFFERLAEKKPDLQPPADKNSRWWAD